MSTTARHPYGASIVRRAIRAAFVKLRPRHMIRNPVMFVVLVGSVLTTLTFMYDLVGGYGDAAFTLQPVTVI